MGVYAMATYPPIVGRYITPDPEGRKPAFLHLPNEKTGLTERLYVNMPVQAINCGLVENIETSIVFPSFDLLYPNIDTPKALRIARQMTHQKRLPKVYMYPDEDCIHVAVTFRVKPIPTSLLKTIIPKKFYPLMRNVITPKVDLISIAEASFQKDSMVAAIFPHLYRANMFKVSIGKQFDKKIDSLWEVQLASYEDKRPERI